MAQQENIHAGHRKRLRERFAKEGLDNFNEVNTLELLLFYCISRRDTNPLAHRLLDRFGKLSDVLDAEPSELMKVEGVSENVATYLKLITAVGRYYQVNRASNVKILSTTESCGRYLVPYFRSLKNETVYVLCLDGKCKVLCCKKVGEGNVNSTSISTRRIVEIALSANATTVILAHNHPSGVAIPSLEDIETTKRLARALRTVEILLADHIVVADDDFVSLAQSGQYSVHDRSLDFGG